MDKNEQIRQGFKSFLKDSGTVKMQTMLAEVKAVDETEATCTLDEDGFEIFDVRLRPVISGKEAITFFPTVGSWVLAVRIEDDEEWMVVAADEITKHRTVVGDCEMEISEGFLIKREGDTLLQVMQLLIESVQKIVVLQGTNPDYLKLQQALIKAQNILK